MNKVQSILTFLSHYVQIVQTIFFVNFSDEAILSCHSLVQATSTLNYFSFEHELYKHNRYSHLLCVGPRKYSAEAFSSPVVVSTKLQSAKGPPESRSRERKTES